MITAMLYALMVGSAALFALVTAVSLMALFSAAIIGFWVVVSMVAEVYI